jgi:type II secretory pathway pseudopilin PulG
VTPRILARRLRARAHRERGFTIVETVIAITVIFGALTALAYTATAGFRSIAYGRERTQATGVANQVMENVRGLAYSKIQGGMKTSELAGDPAVNNCGGTPTVYRYDGPCSGGTLGEKVVSSAFASGYSVPYLVPHTGTVALGGVTYTWKTYVTNDDVSANPYRVTVVVTWDQGAQAGSHRNLVKTQSLFYSPSGCVSAQTHPFAAPCQPFYYGVAQVPQGTVSIDGYNGNPLNLHDTAVDVTNGAITMPGAEANAQQEQVTNLTTKVSMSGASLTTSTGTTEAAGTITNGAADNDQGSSTSTVAGNATITGGTGSVQQYQPDAGGQIGLQLNVGTADSGAMGLSVAAKSTDAFACPPPTAVRENDSLPCASAKVLQGGAITATIPLTHVEASLGSMTAVRINVPSTASTATIDRTAVSGYDGLMSVSASRTLGTIDLGGFPTGGMTAPTGMSSTNTNDTNYCMRIQGYQDSVSGSAGPRTSTNPTASIAAGTFLRYNGSGYTSTGVASIPASVTCASQGFVNGRFVEWTVSISGSNVGTIATSASAPSPTVTTSSDAQTRTEFQSSANAPKLAFRYRLTVDGVDEVDALVTVDLGTLLAHGVYGQPPSAG